MKTTRVGYIEDTKVSTEALVIELEVGESTIEHHHEWMTEIIVFKSYGWLKVENEKYIRSPGDIVFIRPFQKHQVSSKNELCRYVSIRYPFTKDDEKEVPF